MNQPLFSIITPTLNCGRFLPRNLASIRSQGLPAEEIEHWVIDGGSKDGTVEFLREQSDVRFISEEDQGLSDAVNKGIQRATGQWIIWLNADDELAPNALKTFKDALTHHPEARLFCGGQKIFGYDGQLERTDPGWDYNVEELLGTRTSIIQASTFAHRSVYEKVGLLKVDFRRAMDYEWTVRAAREFRCQPLPDILTHYHRRPGSIMDANMAGFFREFLRVRRTYHLSRLGPGELRIRFYLATEPLRQIQWLRRCVRSVKRIHGCEPAHPVPGA
jgi:glycosyltransferase involved in cell wall biosynthesis